VIVDLATNELINDKHRKVFDHIIPITVDDSKGDDWKFRNEWQAWWLTPFKETIKLEADILLTTNIDHWWSGLQQREVTLTTQVRDYEGTVATSRAYRKLFDENLLPNVYNGVMYFRYGKISMEFFTLARSIFANWDLFKTQVLKNCRDEYPTTDVVFALAAEMIGIDKCTNPALSYPTFVHMKPAIQGWGNVKWMNTLYSQLDKTDLTIGFTKQLYPFHYHNKEFITPDIIEYYEQLDN
jgi:hypothetical protein